MSKFTIILGGDVTPTHRLSRQIAGSRVIAADSGIRHAATLGLVPELWTGDFDSVADELRTAHKDIPTEIFPQDKDMTDGEIAVEAALARGAGELILVGAFGGPRADHALLHLTAAVALAERGLDIVLTSGTQEGTPLETGHTHFDYAPDTLFSIIGFSDISGLTLRGVRWPLTAHNVAFGSSLTLSNEVQTGGLIVRLAAGRAMLMAHPHSFFAM